MTKPGSEAGVTFVTLFFLKTSLLSFVLVIIYFILFGLASLKHLSAGDITITRNEESSENITSPGEYEINCCHYLTT